MNGHRGFGVAAGLWIAVAAYGSLVPFRFESSIGWADALAQFTSLEGPGLGFAKGDLAVNLLVFLPVGFCAAAAVTGVFRPFAAALAVTAFCALSAFALEFAQVFVRDRTPGWPDVVGLTAGGAVGAAAWMLLGGTLWRGCRTAQALPHWNRLRLVVSALSIGWVLLSLLPLAFPEHAYPLPRSIWLLAGDRRPTSLVIADGVLTALAVAPFGLAAAWLPPRRWRVPATIAAIALILVLDSIRQLNPLDTPPSATWRIGGVIGALGAGLWFGNRTLTLSQLSWCAWTVVMAVWTGVLCCLMWAPFDFGLDPNRLSARVRLLFERVPLHRYYWAPPLLALRMILESLILGGAFGFIAGLQLTRPWTVAVALCVFGLLEWAQLHLPRQRPDVTDVVLGTLGASAGSQLTEWLRESLAQTKGPRKNPL